MSEITGLIVQVASALICFILVRYMIKPYTLTREERYIGLPLGFTFLGISEALLAIGLASPPLSNLRYISLGLRAFAFVFIAFTYYFSKQPSKNSRVVWISTLSLIVVGITSVSLILVADLLISLGISAIFGTFLRALELVFLLYICMHTLRNHVKTPDSTTIWIPLGFILFTISQYSMLIRAAEENYLNGVAWAGGLITRLAGLAVFLFVAYQAFHKSRRGE
jgi:hypothetical protein